MAEDTTVGAPTDAIGVQHAVAAASPNFERILGETPALIMLIDDASTVTWVNDAVTALFGYTPAECIGRSVLDFLDPEWDDPLALESVATAMAGEGTRPPMLFRIARKDGSTTMVEVTANTQFDDPDLHCMVVLVRPWDERHLIDETLEAMAAARPLDEALRLLVRIAEADTMTADTSIIVDLDLESRRRTIHSDSLPALLTGEPGLTEDDPWASVLAQAGPRVWALYDLPTPLAQLAEAAGYRSCWVWPAVSGDRHVATVAAWRREERLDRDQTRMVAMGRLARVTGLVITKSRSDAELEWAATHDPLTRLANRARFFAELDEVVNAPRAAWVGAGSEDLVGVVAVDLDGFKEINDDHGHAAGDEVLRAVAQRLVEMVGPRGLSARLGGDEFVAVLTDLGTDAQLDAFGRELAAALRQPIEWSGAMLSIGASVGLASDARGNCSPDELVEAADVALYRAKDGGRGMVRRSPVGVGGARPHRITRSRTP